MKETKTGAGAEGGRVIPLPRQAEEPAPESKPEVRKLEFICLDVLSLQKNLWGKRGVYKYDPVKHAEKRSRWEHLSDLTTHIFILCLLKEEISVELLEKTLESCISFYNTYHLAGLEKSAKDLADHIRIKRLSRECTGS